MYVYIHTNKVVFVIIAYIACVYLCTYTLYIPMYITCSLINIVPTEQILGENVQLLSSPVAHVDSDTDICFKSKQSAKFCFFITLLLFISNILSKCVGESKTVLKPDINESEQL